MRGLGSKALTEFTQRAIEEDKPAIGFGVSTDGKEIVIMCTRENLVMSWEDGEQVLLSMRENQENARKIRAGEIRIGLPPEAKP